jgi:RNA ligase (TIGR02306 family)
LPDKPWAEMFKKRGNRVKAMKLRGIWSFGIVMSPYDVCDIGDLKGMLMPENIGKDIADRIGVTKYEAPAPQMLDAKGPLPFGLNKTDEERYQNFLELPFGEEVMVSLKVDGQSATYYCHKDRQTGMWTTGICSRSLEMKPECDNNYTRINAKYNILNMLARYCKHHDVSLALRGEIYGNGIQAHAANPHSKVPLNFAAFNVYNFDTFSYENYESVHYYEDVCRKINVPTVPNIGSQTLTQDLIKHYAEDISEIDGKPFEGVVIKHKNGSFKIINLNYDERK